LRPFLPLFLVRDLLLLELVNGAWMGNFAALKSIHLFAIAFVILFLNMAFCKLYLRTVCDDPNLCKKPNNLRFQKFILWIIALLMLASLLKAKFCETNFQSEAIVVYKRY